MIVFAVNGDWLATSLHLSESTLGVGHDRHGDRRGGGDHAHDGRRRSHRPRSHVDLGDGRVRAADLGNPGVRADQRRRGGRPVRDPRPGDRVLVRGGAPPRGRLDPDNRARAISHAFVIITGSRAIGSVAAGWIYGAGGFAAISVVAAVVAAAATAALIAGRASRRPQDRRRTTPA